MGHFLESKVSLQSFDFTKCIKTTTGSTGTSRRRSHVSSDVRKLKMFGKTGVKTGKLGGNRENFMKTWGKPEKLVENFG